MKIPVGKYTITSDKHNIICNTTKKVKTGKMAGQEILEPEAFCFDIDECMEYIIHQGIRESEATTIKGLMATVKKIQKDVDEALKR